MSGVPPTAALTHFCERHGPSVVVTTQMLRLCMHDEGKRDSAVSADGSEEPAYRFPPSFLRDVAALSTQEDPTSKGGEEDDDGSSEANSGPLDVGTPTGSGFSYTFSPPSSPNPSSVSPGSSHPEAGLRVKIRQQKPSLLDHAGISSSLHTPQSWSDVGCSPRRGDDSPLTPRAASSGAESERPMGRNSSSSLRSMLLAQSAPYQTLEGIDLAVSSASSNAKLSPHKPFSKSFSKSALDVSIVQRGDTSQPPLLQPESPSKLQDPPPDAAAGASHLDTGSPRRLADNKMSRVPEEDTDEAVVMAPLGDVLSNTPANDDDVRRKLRFGSDAEESVKPIVVGNLGENPRPGRRKRRSTNSGLPPVLAPSVSSEGRRRSPSVSNVSVHVRQSKGQSPEPESPVPSAESGSTLSAKACGACASVDPGRGLFSMDTERGQVDDVERSFFITTAKPPPASYAAVRTAALRVLSSEVAPGGRGAVLLSLRKSDIEGAQSTDKGRPNASTVWLFAYLFSLKDALHRGQNRRYAFVVLLPTAGSPTEHREVARHAEVHSFVLVRCADFVTRFFSKMVDSMQNLCNSRFTQERKQSRSVQPQLRTASRGVGGIPNRFAGSAAHVRPLTELLDDPQFFVNLHYRFCWLLRSLAESLYVVNLTPRWLPLTTAAAADVALTSAVQSPAAIRPELLVTLGDLSSWLGDREFRVLLHHLLVGNQLVVRLRCPRPPAEVAIADIPAMVEIIDSFMDLLRKLIPFSSHLVGLRRWENRYLQPWECSMLSLLVCDDDDQFFTQNKAFSRWLSDTDRKLTSAKAGDVPLEDIADISHGISVAIVEVSARGGLTGDETGVQSSHEVMTRWQAKLVSLASCERGRVRGSHSQLNDEYVRVAKCKLSLKAEQAAVAFVKEGWKTKARQYARTLLECEDEHDARLIAVRQAWQVNSSDEMCLRNWAGGVRRAERVRHAQHYHGFQKPCFE